MKIELKENKILEVNGTHLRNHAGIWRSKTGSIYISDGGNGIALWNGYNNLYFYEGKKADTFFAEHNTFTPYNGTITLSN